jgi:hypothetical protein
MRIVITGFPKHGPYLARLLSERGVGIRAAYYSDSRSAVLQAAAHAMFADASISFGGPRPKEIVQKICNARGRPAILLWAGSDVLTIAESPRELERLRLSNVLHWTTAPHLVAELSELGISARYVNVASDAIPATITPIPTEFTVLTYLPKPRREFYGQPAVWDAARALSDVRFIVVGEGAPEPNAPPNVEYVGDVSDMGVRINAASVLLRLTEHDGLARGVVEALARGRYAIWTYDLPGVIRVTSTQQAIQELRALREAHRANRLPINETGLKHVAACHSPAAVAQGVLDSLQAAAETARSMKPAGAYRLAISGHDLYAARVAENCAKYSTHFSASVLSTRNRSETALSLLELLASDAWYTIGAPRQPRLFELAAAVSRKPRILHWLGNDVAVLRDDKRLLHALQSRRCRHLAQNERVSRELESLGLCAETLPVPAALTPPGVRDLPKQFTLLVYLPREHPGFYGRYQYERLMLALSGQSIHYIIVGGGHIDVPAGVSVERIPWRADLAQIYDRSTALIRFTQPDSVSIMVVEALLHGRHVLWSNDFPFVIRVRDSHDLENAVRGLLQQHAAGTLFPQTAAARAIGTLYSPERCLASLAQA